MRALAVVLWLLDGGCSALQPSVARSAAPGRSVLCAKKSGGKAGGGFGAAPRAKSSAPVKPLKSQVAEARSKWPVWGRGKDDGQTADVWIATREGKEWFHVGHVCCSPDSSLDGAVQMQKALIFKLGAWLALPRNPPARRRTEPIRPPQA